MRRAGPWLAGLCVLAFALLNTARALDVPAFSARVMDTANLLDANARAMLESKLKSHEEASGQQFALLTIPSLEGDPLEDFSIRVVESWKLGRAKQDDGVLVLIVRDDKKARIEVGVGLEGAIPDAVAGRVIRDVIAPSFRRGEYAAGIDQAFDFLLARARGEAVQPPQRARDGGDGSSVLAIIVFGFVLFFILSRFFGGRGGRGGPRRRTGGGFVPGFGTGFGAGYASGGGFDGGGSSWDGGGGGSDFGGGGGGDFGGGGASGDW